VVSNPNNSHRAAVAALVISSVLWGMAFLLAKLAFAELTVSQVVLYRFGLASLVLLPVAWLRRAWPGRRDLPLFLLTGFLNVPLTFLLQFGGLALTSVASASLIIGTLPPLLALAAAGLYHEKLGPRGWGAVGISTLGVALIVGLPGTDRNWLGDGLVFLSLIVVVAWVLLSKRLIERHSALPATAYILAFGTLTLLPISLLWDGPPPLLSLPPGIIGSLLVLGLVCTATTFIMWNWALERYPASRAGVFVNIEPVVGALLGVTVLGESLGPGALLGGLLIITSAWLVSRPEDTSTKTYPEPPQATAPSPEPDRCRP
jgi:drug/metabolite transporter (DMT)-like permease